MKAIYKRVLGAMVLTAAIMPGTFALATDQTVADKSIVREINDPHNGARWLLLVDPNHRGGPGRLVLAGAMDNKYLLSKTDVQRTESSLPPVIHTGERLILEEHSPVLDGRLDAIALNPAGIGGTLRVRLVVGGQVVRALAVAPGFVILTQEKDGRQ